MYRVAVPRPGDARHAGEPNGAADPQPEPSPQLPEPIFHQPWWLDAVAPRRWDAVTVERGGRTVARLPFLVRGPRRMRVLTQPPLTPFLGPWVAPEPGAKYAKALGDEMDLQAELEAALPAAAAFRQNFAATVPGCLPFLWAGYRAGVRYTYRLEDLRSEPELWAGLGGNIRREIRKARQRVEVREDLGVDRFHAVWAKTFQRQGLTAPDRSRLERIEGAAADRGARAMLFACDESDRIHAVAYLVWDRHTAYYLMGGGDPQLRTSGASSLLMWEAIRRARGVTGVFDFEGSMLQPVERFFRAFGGRQAPYLHVSRASPLAGAVLAVRGNAQRLLARRYR
jgi:Acetyltransferase (GNAT) domain